MRTGLLQLDGLFIEFAGAAVGVGGDPLSHDLDAMFAVGVEEDDDGVPLGVVQGVHCLRCHIKQGVFVLCGGRSRDMR